MKRAIVVLLAGAAAGCGGGGGDERLSRAELVERADAICSRYEARLDALGRPTNASELRSFADRALPIARDGREELGELNPPEELEATYDAWLEQGDEAIEIVERLREAAAESNEVEIQQLAEDAQRTDAESNRLARELGFEQCGAAGAPGS